MPQETQRLADLVIDESSGVDFPANLSDGWLVMKGAESTTAQAVPVTWQTSNGTTTVSFTTNTTFKQASLHEYEDNGSGKCKTCGMSRQEHDAEMAALTKATKTEGGQAFPASDYAYVPDRNAPSTWKLRLTSTPGGAPDTRIVGAAVAALGPGGFRGRKVQIPQADLGRVKAKVRAAWKKANPGKAAEDMPSVLKSEGGQMPDINRDELADDLKEFIEGLEAKLSDAEKAKEEAEKAVAEAKAKEGDPPKDDPIDKATLPPAVRKALEDAEARQKVAEDAAKEQAEKAVEVEKRLAAIEKEKRLGQFVAKAKDELPHLGKAEAVGAQLLEVADKFGEDSETFKSLVTTMKSANEQIEKGSLFKQFGQPGAEPADVEARINKAAQDRVSEGKSPSFEQAVMDVMKADSSLRKEYADLMAQRNGR